jgi:hypothetical protein
MRGLKWDDALGAAPDELFHALFKIVPREENSMVTGRADNADIRPEPHDFPFVPAAWMRFAQANDIVHVELERHGVRNYNIVIRASVSQFTVAA